jgi:hypothetical protein
MQAINGSGGLCMTCNNAPGCYHRARRGPALFCELFDGYAPPVEWTRVARATPLSEPRPAARAVKEEGPKYAGLCMNCRHRATCGHPKATGGVWHCEDYE